MISLNHALANLVREGKITLDTAKSVLVIFQSLNSIYNKL